MKTNAELQQERRIIVEQLGEDGGSGWIPGLDKKKPNRQARVVWSNGGGWDHVSVSWQDRCPTWDEMAKVKKLFFYPEEICVEYHPPESEYVNFHPFCLHIWRYQQPGMPMPSSWMVGPKKGQTQAQEIREGLEALQPTRERTEHQVLDGLKCYQRMGELDKEFTCRMELCPYWGEDDDTSTSTCNVPQIIADAIALMEGEKRHGFD